MYLITDKIDNKIIEYGEKLDYLENGYPRLINENVAFPTELVDVNQVDEIPDFVEREKYCYTEEKGFYKNENWVPYYSTEDRIAALEDVVNMLLLGGNE